MNNSRIVTILEKWPVNPHKKTRDFGNHLRELVKNNFGLDTLLSENQRHINEKLNALERLCRDEYKNKYSSNYNVGATGLSLKDLNKILTDDFLEKKNKKMV